MNGEMTRVDSFRDLRNTDGVQHIWHEVWRTSMTLWFLRVLLGIPWHFISFMGVIDGPLDTTLRWTTCSVGFAKMWEMWIGEVRLYLLCRVEIYVGHHRANIASMEETASYCFKQNDSTPIVEAENSQNRFLWNTSSKLSLFFFRWLEATKATRGESFSASLAFLMKKLSGSHKSPILGDSENKEGAKSLQRDSQTFSVKCVVFDVGQTTVQRHPCRAACPTSSHAFAAAETGWGSLVMQGYPGYPFLHHFPLRN